MRGRLAGVGSERELEERRVRAPLGAALKAGSVAQIAEQINRTSRTFSEAIARTEALATGTPVGPKEKQPDPRAALALPPPLRKKLAQIRVLVDAFWED